MAPALHTERLGEGRRVVLAHGFTQTGRCWAPVARPNGGEREPRLSGGERDADGLARDHEVVLVDAPGHGGSAEVRADLWEGAELLGEAGGRATYVGYSMGARLCLHLALSHPELVEALVLVSGTPGIDDEGERGARRSADGALADRIEAEGVPRMLDEWLAGPLFARLPPEAAYREERERNTPEGLASSLRLAGTGTQEPLWNRLDELDMPVLVVAGESDAKFVAIAERMAPAIGANAALAIIEGVGHAVPWEKPQALLRLFRDWERNLTSPTA